MYAVSLHFFSAPQSEAMKWETKEEKMSAGVADIKASGINFSRKCWERITIAKKIKIVESYSLLGLLAYSI